MNISQDTISDLSLEIVDIKLIESTLRLPRPELGKPTFFTQNIILHHQGQLEGNIIIGRITVQIFHEDNSEELIGLITVSVVFKIPKLKNIVDDRGKQPKIRRDILDYLNIIVSSTARGMMYQAFKGTILSNVILPLFSTKDAYSFTEDWTSEEE